MGSHRSKEEDVMKISTSIFVFNLPDRFGAKELWNICQAYGHVIDSYIPDRRSKAGKRFGFVQFIKVHDVDKLVNNMFTVWVGRNKLHANVARFQRATKVNQRSVDNNYGRKSDNSVRAKNGDENKGMHNSFVQVVRGEQCQMESQSNIPTMVLGESCLNKEEISLRLMGKVKEFASLNNLKIMLAHHEFIVEERVVWIEVEGMPWRWWSINTFNRIASRWGTHLNGDDLEEGDFHSNRLCICTKMKSIISVIQNDVSWEAMLGSCHRSAQETCFEEWIATQNVNDNAGSQREAHSEDPFGIYAALNKKKDQCNNDNNVEGSLKYPPGFTPSVEDGSSFAPVNKVEENKSCNEPVNRMNLDQHVNLRIGVQSDTNESNCSGHFKKSTAPRTGGSILHLIDDLVKCWGNFAFDYAYSKAVGNSGGILCIWDPNMFIKLNETISDYFTIVRGTWVPSGMKLLIVSVYAPQESKEKVMLWDYIRLVVSNWDGQVIIMGDFNEVRYISERFGSVFNKKGAEVFNNFINNAGLVEVPLGGCSFTWCHKFAKKMSKLDRFLISNNLISSCHSLSAVALDRFLSDHHPILMHEFHKDYGPIPFKKFHYWFDLDGFDKFVEKSWKEDQVYDQNPYSRLMKKLKMLKDKIRGWTNIYKEGMKSGKRTLKAELDIINTKIDRGEGDDSDTNRRLEIIRLIQDIDKVESMEMAQKAKIKWVIEGDENSKYYHGVINKKRSRFAVRGVLADGTWIYASNAVKMEFFEHFKIRFGNPEAVWDCGTDKMPRPDGFTFGYYWRYWSFIEKDVVDAIRPISLIGSVYKIIAKILANRLTTVLGDLVNEIQSAFVTDRQTLDGSFILNELVQWCKSKKKQTMVFKVDFEKAYDSVRWDFLDDVMKKLGFG
nr:RNA-directed DNA polymerase, eukaryota [Tanacetum cinerariifolium]